MLSRRTLVSSAAALPAPAVPAVALADNLDAELLRLGAELEPLERQHNAITAVARTRQQALYAEVERQTGIAFQDVPAYPEGWDYWAVFDRVQQARRNPDEDDWEDFNEQLWVVLNLFSIFGRKHQTG